MKTTRSALVLAAAVVVACHDHGPGEGHDHDEGASHAHGADHEDGSEEHEHGHGGGIAVTHFTEVSELFVEFDPLVVGQESAFAAHFTRLDTYRAVKEGTATVVLSGGGAPEETFSAPVSRTPGIFRPVATPKHAVERTVTLRLETPELKATHDLGTHPVHADPSRVPEPAEDETSGAISFLKEQQWKLPFRVEPVGRRTLHAGLQVFGRVRARPDAEAAVTAPSHGRLVAGTDTVSIGATVKRGQTLAILAPTLDTGGDLASLQLAVDRAKVALDHGERELARVTDLLAKGAVSERRVADARLARDQAAAELKAARRRVAQIKRLQQPGARRSRDVLEVRAPIAGTVVDARATPGGVVEDGQMLFRIVNPELLRVHAYVPEGDLAVLGSIQGAWVWLAPGGHGRDDAEPIKLGPESIISTAGPVDARRRAVEVLFSLPDGARARVGQAIDVEILHGDPVESLAVPTSAVVREGAIPHAFVMLGGESFERRQLQLGIRDGAFVAVTEGLTEGERVVTTGADLVAQAQAAPAEAGHGHPH